MPRLGLACALVLAGCVNAGAQRGVLSSGPGENPEVVWITQPTPTGGTELFACYRAPADRPGPPVCYPARYDPGAPPREAAKATTPAVGAKQAVSFVTDAVVSFRQLLGDPALRERGRALIRSAQWRLGSDGSLTFAPAEPAPGFFPIQVQGHRDGRRISFDGARTGRAADGAPAYVRISGILLVGQADPVLTVDVEFGRDGSGYDGDLGEPTYRARARLRLVKD